MAVDEGHQVSLRLARSAADILNQPWLTLTVIDIPIGLNERVPRRADRLARSHLGRRGCTVFPAPYRQMLAATGQSPEVGQQEASGIRRSIDGKGCSRQAYMIFGKINDVDEVITAADKERLVEGHPEVSFAQMNGGQPIQTKKARLEGRDDRLRALEPHFGDVRPLITVERELGAEANAVLDALALLWTARRLAKGEKVFRLPDPAEVVGSGLTAQIVA